MNMYGYALTYVLMCVQVYLLIMHFHVYLYVSAGFQQTKRANVKVLRFDLKNYLPLNHWI